MYISHYSGMDEHSKINYRSMKIRNTWKPAGEHDLTLPEKLYKGKGIPS